MSEVLPITHHSQQIEGLCQALYYYQLLTTVSKLKDYVRGCSTTNYWPQSTNLRIMSGVVLLPYTKRSELVDELCQRLYYYHILTAVNKLTNYVRGCTTTKYWPESTSCRIMSEVVLLPNTERSQQVEGLCQRLCYYQKLTTVNKLKNYVRGCTTTNYWPQSTS